MSVSTVTLTPTVNESIAFAGLVYPSEYESLATDMRRAVDLFAQAVIFGGATCTPGERQEPLRQRLDSLIKPRLTRLFAGAEKQAFVQALANRVALLAEAHVILKGEEHNLEMEWFCRVAKVKLSVHLLFEKMQAFDQQMRIAKQEAAIVNKIQSSVLGHKTLNWELYYQHFGTNKRCFGEAKARSDLCSAYALFLQKFVAPVETLHASFRDSCLEAVRLEIAKMQAEQPPEAALGPAKDLSSLSFVDAALFIVQRYEQRNSSLQEKLRSSNLRMKGENADARFAQIARRCLDKSGFSALMFRFYANCFASYCTNKTKYYTERFAAMHPSMQGNNPVAGEYTKGIELAKTTNATLTEMEELLKKIEAAE